MAVTPEFAAHAARVSSPKLLLIEQSFLNPSTEVVTVQRYATHAFTTRPTDAPANEFYTPRVRDDFDIDLSIVAGSRFRGQSQVDTGTIRVLDLDGSLQALDGLETIGQPLVIRAGSPNLAYGESAVIFDGLVGNYYASEDGLERFVVPQSNDALADCDLARKFRFQGLGLGLLCDDGRTDYAHWAHDASMVPTTFLVVEAYVEIASDATMGRVQTFVGKGMWSGAAAEWTLSSNTSDKPRFRFNDSGGTIREVVGTTTLVAGGRYRISGTWSSTDGFTIRVDGVIEGTDATAVSAHSGKTGSLSIGAVHDEASNKRTLDGWVTDVRVYVDGNAAVQGDVIGAIYPERDGPLKRAYPSNMVFHAKTEEGLGTSTWDSVQNLQGTLTGTAGDMWVSTKTGTEDMATRARPVSLGAVLHRNAILIDPVFLWYELHCRAVEGIDGVYAGGVKLAPDYKVTSTGVTFGAVSGRQRVAAADLDCRALAPGQSVAVTGSTSNDATLTVTRVDEDSGLWFEVSQTLTTEAPGATVTIQTPTLAIEYYAHPSEGRVRLENNPNLPVTARLRGDNAGAQGYVNRAGDLAILIMKDFCGIPAATVGELSFNNLDLHNVAWIEAQYATDLEDIPARDVIDMLVQGVGGNWGPEPETGTIEAGYVGAELSGSHASTYQLAIDESIDALGLSEVEGTPPVQRIAVNYARNFAQLRWDELAGSLQGDVTAEAVAWKQFLQSRNDQVSSDEEDPNVVDPVAEIFGDATEDSEVIDSLIVHRGDAHVIATNEFARFGRQQLHYVLRTKIQPLVLRFRGTEITVTSPRFKPLLAGKALHAYRQTRSRTHVTTHLWGTD